MPVPPRPFKGEFSPPEPDPEPDEEFDSNTLKVLNWRAEELERAGAPPLLANTLAAHREVDLHQACRVVKGLLEKGLDVSLAVDILT